MNGMNAFANGDAAYHRELRHAETYAKQATEHERQLQEHIDQLEKDVAHWKNNHATEVRRARILKERTDMPIERVQAYEQWGKDQERFQRELAQAKELMSNQKELIMHLYKQLDEAKK